jgi:hypothetical protein
VEVDLVEVDLVEVDLVEVDLVEVELVELVGLVDLAFYLAVDWAAQTVYFSIPSLHSKKPDSHLDPRSAATLD